MMTNINTYRLVLELLAEKVVVGLKRVVRAVNNFQNRPLHVTNAPGGDAFGFNPILDEIVPKNVPPLNVIRVQISFEEAANKWDPVLYHFGVRNDAKNIDESELHGERDILFEKSTVSEKLPAKGLLEMKKTADEIRFREIEEECLRDRWLPIARKVSYVDLLREVRVQFVQCFKDKPEDAEKLF